MRDHRDSSGRFPPGVRGTPRGRRPVSEVVKMVEAARKAGASIVITLPPKADDPAPTPPAAA